MSNHQRVEKNIHSKTYSQEFLIARNCMEIAVIEMIKTIIHNLETFRQISADCDKLLSRQQFTPESVADYFRTKNYEELSENLKSKNHFNRTMKSISWSLLTEKNRRIWSTKENSEINVWKSGK